MIFGLNLDSLVISQVGLVYKYEDNYIDVALQDWLVTTVTTVTRWTSTLLKIFKQRTIEFKVRARGLRGHRPSAYSTTLIPIKRKVNNRPRINTSQHTRKPHPYHAVNQRWHLQSQNMKTRPMHSTITYGTPIHLLDLSNQQSFTPLRSGDKYS